MWKIVTEADLAATISQREIDVFRRDAQPGASDPVEALLERTAARVRIYVASNRAVTMGEYPSVPASLVSTVCDLAAYDIVFIGFPIWWYREPSIIDTFVEGNAEALAGKTIVPFATSGGSGMGDSSANLQALAPKAKVAEGRRFRASVSADDLAKWAKEVR